MQLQNKLVHIRRDKEWLVIRNLQIENVEKNYFEWIFVKAASTKIDNLNALQLKAFFEQKGIKTIIEE